MGEAAAEVPLAGGFVARGVVLRQTIDAWSSDDRAAVGAFLQQRIAAEHADNPAAGWTEALTAALDYRRWHEFTIQRFAGGQWRPATGPASGGERALIASVPLFAAASSHYKSAANPHAPRLIALDEAFAGVDDDSRAKGLGLLATFDSDVVMTSEREWGCYPRYPGSRSASWRGRTVSTRSSSRRGGGTGGNVGWPNGRRCDQY